ncbi:hypothetical protein ACIP8U_00460 [Streptomyces pseudovenezuelae]|uniref:hypothetical protein n=1 Tax=Streptomyces pseudovenezuelae TaxID=67350 RepID=UPI00382D3B95
MTEATPNQGLFRIYAVNWLVGAAMVVTVAFTASDLPDLGIAIYLGIGLTLWIVDMVLTKGAPRTGHALSHAMLAAAFALVWPLVVVALVMYLASGVIAGVRR